MSKQSIFGRISTLVRANINAMIDQAEDPEKMLDQLIRDFTNNIADAEAAIAETIGGLRLLERDYEEDKQTAAEWGNKAIAASRKADELRTGGDTAGGRQVRQPRQGGAAAADRRREGGEGRRAADRLADGGRSRSSRAASTA